MSHEIYETRYQATKHKTDRNDVVVKVCAGGDKIGYMVLNCFEYQQWKNNR